MQTSPQVRIHELFELREELLMDKMNKYGASNLDRIGIYGIYSRMADKIERLRNSMNGDIIKGEAEITTDDNLREAVIDTIRDLAGYSVLFELMLEHTEQDGK